MSNQVRNSEAGNALSDEALSHAILSCAFKVHTALGPGLLETVYRTCLAYEIRKLGFIALEEVYVSVTYDQMIFDKGFRMDILVEDRYVLELKVVERFQEKHIATILSYLRFAGVKRGLLLNFMEKSLHPKGIKRVVNAKMSAG